MTAPRSSARIPDEVTVEWRRGVLRRSGFPRGLAVALARDARYDLHALIEMTERGCPPSLAERILAPLSSGAPQSEETP